MSARANFLSPTRRGVLGGLAFGGAGGLGVSTAFAGPAHAAEGDDYRAIVCIMLEGGADNWSMLVPFDEVGHAGYAAARSGLAIARNQLAATALKPLNDLGGYAYALNPLLGPLIELFNAGDLAIIQNIGALVAPTSSSMFLNGSGPLPSRLFSHNSQREFVQTGQAEGGTTGWGGRIGDAVAGLNAHREFTCINAGQTNTSFLFGNSVMPYAVDDNGAKLLLGGREDRSTAMLRAIAASPSSNVFRQEYANVVQRALNSGSRVASIFAQVSDTQIPELALGENDLARQLRAVLKMILGARPLGMKRQVFYVRLRNWDAHNASADTNGNFARLSAAMLGFQRALNRWGMGSNVTTFTLSDFGRSLVGNGNGSDHGWGSVQFVMGGAVRGGMVYGRPPSVSTSSSDGVLGGRLVPTIPIDSLAATLAGWMGISPEGWVGIAPNLARFDLRAWNLGLFE